MVGSQVWCAFYTKLPLIFGRRSASELIEFHFGAMTTRRFPLPASACSEVFRIQMIRCLCFVLICSLLPAKNARPYPYQSVWAVNQAVAVAVTDFSLT